MIQPMYLQMVNSNDTARGKQWRRTACAITKAIEQMVHSEPAANVAATVTPHLRLFECELAWTKHGWAVQPTEQDAEAEMWRQFIQDLLRKARFARCHRCGKLFAVSPGAFKGPYCGEQCMAKSLPQPTTLDA